MHIASAGNSETTCFQVVLEKGYKISSIIDEKPPICVHFTAEKDGNSFVADSGIELLGLIALWEHYGHDWQQGLGKDTWEKIG